MIFMSVISLSPENFDHSSIEMHPSRSFSSSSLAGAGITGSIFVYANRSKIEKDTDFTIKEWDEGIFGGTAIGNVHSIFEEFTKAKANYGHPVDDNGIPIVDDPVENMAPLVEEYTSSLKQLAISSRKHHEVRIRRHRASADFSTSSMLSNITRESLYLECASRAYDRPNWAYGNYHCLNFFTGSLHLAEDTALIYPAPTSSYWPATKAGGGGKGFVNPYRQYYPYRPHNKFTFEFYVNPRYNHLSGSGEFHAGTIMHMSSCYAISLVTASQDINNSYIKDLKGNPRLFQVMLQLSQSTETPPSAHRLDLENNSTSRQYPNDLVFLSSASLKYNHWHHVAIRWGGPSVNQGRGEFVIDGKIDSVFQLGWGLLPDGTSALSQSVMPTQKGSTGWPNNDQSQPDALFIGNFYDGPNNYKSGDPAAPERNQIAQFFNVVSQYDEGVPHFRPATDTNENDPTVFSFSNPLQAEVHELKIWRIYRTLNELVSSSLYGDPVKKRIFDRKTPPAVSPSPLGVPLTATGFAREPRSNGDPELMFYVPPFFVRESPNRKVLATPWLYHGQNISVGIEVRPPEITTTYTPFNSELAFRTNACQINLQNFTREFVLSSYPRLYNLTGAIRTANKHTPQDPPQQPALRADGFGTQLQLPTVTIPSVYMFGNNQTERERLNKANLTVMPCDNGLLLPPFPSTLLTGSFTLQKWRSTFLDSEYFKPSSTKLNAAGQQYGEPLLTSFVDDDGILDLSLISLNNLVGIDETKIIQMDKPDGDPAFDPEDATAHEFGLTDSVDEAGYVGPTAFFPQYNTFSSLETSVILALREPSSNFFTFYSVPVLYYGDKILPNSLTIRGKAGAMKPAPTFGTFREQIPLTLKDNGRGGLYRADAVTPHAAWNVVGDVLYEEGLIIVKSPHIFDMGQEEYFVDFKGLRNVHVLEMMIPVHAGWFGNSQNETYKDLRPSDHINDEKTGFTYITSLNLHDDNFNIIGRANLAQPVIKRPDDKLFFRLKIDF